MLIAFQYTKLLDFILLYFDFLLLFPVSQPDRAWEPVPEPGAGVPLGSRTATLRP